MAIAARRMVAVAGVTDELADASSDGFGIFLTLVPGTTREVADEVAAELGIKPYVLRVEVVPCTWAISPDEPCLNSSTANDHPRLFGQLLLAFYLYDPEGIGVANS